MKVSVALVTYNHCPFIEQALNSVLGQKLDQPWEVVIGDDASNDGTRLILEDYQRRFPDKIRLQCRDSHAGDGGRSNYIATLHACRGEYIAYLDGDDYWTGDDKLSRQVALLDAQPELSACAHPVARIRGDGRGDVFRAPPDRVPFTRRDIARNFTFFHGGSLVYRRSALPRLPVWFQNQQLKLDDWALSLLCAEHGDIGYLDEVLGIYRKHEGGIWSGEHRLQRLVWELNSREFVFRQPGTADIGPTSGLENFSRHMAGAERSLRAGRLMSSRFRLSLALARFPYRASLSNTYRLMYLIETWLAFSKPVLNTLRRLWWRR